MNIAAVKEAIRALRRSQAALADVVARTWPVDADIHWDKGGHRQYGQVVHHAGVNADGAIRVKNERTGKTYWITMYDVVGYVK